MFSIYMNNNLNDIAIFNISDDEINQSNAVNLLQNNNRIKEKNIINMF